MEDSLACRGFDVADSFHVILSAHSQDARGDREGPLRECDQSDACTHEPDLPESTLLKANESAVVDFLVLVDDSRFPTGAVSWYAPLTPGVYELSIQRRIGCCDGPMIESNKISFEVVP